MKQNLLTSITNHVFDSFYVSKQNTSSILMNDNLKLSKKLKFEDIENDVWAGDIILPDNTILHLILADCSQSNLNEYCLIIKLGDQPSFGLYNGEKSLIYINFKDFWVESSIIAACNLIIGLETLKLIDCKISKVKDENRTLDLIKDYIRHIEAILDYENE